jgi:uncharacterized protein DUF2569
MGGFPMDEYPAEFPGELDFAIKPKAVPPLFGIWLNLMAIGLTLTFVRIFSAIFGYRGDGAPGGYSGIDVIEQAVISAWALANLILMLKRSRRFPKLMIAMLGTGAVLQVFVAAWQLRTAPATAAWGLKLAILGAPALAFFWIAYLLRSKHVRKVFVR